MAYLSFCAIAFAPIFRLDVSQDFFFVLATACSQKRKKKVANFGTENKVNASYTTQLPLLGHWHLSSSGTPLRTCSTCMPQPEGTCYNIVQ
jgi:hypothetical protein